MAAKKRGAPRKQAGRGGRKPAGGESDDEARKERRGAPSGSAPAGRARRSPHEREGAVEIREAIEGLQRLSTLFSERRRQLAREAGLSEAQWQVLESVEGDDFMPSMFARTRSVTPAAVSRTLRQLQEGDLLRASIAEGDARHRSYRLTARGRRTLERLRASRARAIEDIWQEFAPAELRAFTRFANVLSERLEAYLA